MVFPYGYKPAQIAAGHQRNHAAIQVGEVAHQSALAQRAVPHLLAEGGHGPLGNAHLSLDAFEGKEGIRLRAISTADGAKLAECELDALPVFDGLAAAGKLYLATKDGKVLCFSGDK